MSNETLNSSLLPEDSASNDEMNFGDILSSFESKHPDAPGDQTVLGTVISVKASGIYVDIGRKIEGVLPLAKWMENAEADPVPGTQITVTIGPRNEEGYYGLSTLKVERPKDWTALQRALDEQQTVAGVVVEQVKGGFRVDIGVRAFMPASRSGVREMADMAALVGQEIQCRVTKLDTEKEDVVVDRRAVLEEENAKRRQEVFAGLSEGAVVHGRVRSVMDFGAFVDVGGVDGLLHVIDMAFQRVAKASDLVKVGDELDVKVLKIDPATKKISLGLKQLGEDPWTVAARTFNVGDRVPGTVSRLTDFGAFIELLPGVDGLIHVSELSWHKRVRKPGDLLKIGDRVETVILQVNPADRRIGLGYKQALGDPWDAVPEKYPIGASVDGQITTLMQFGAFVDLGDEIEGMIHIADITNEKRLDHPKEKLAKGQTVRAVVLEVDRDKRRIRLGMKQLEPTTVDHYISEHQPGQTVSGRLVEIRGNHAKVELGEGVMASCELGSDEEAPKASAVQPAADVSSLSAMLTQRWKGGGTSDEKTKPKARPGEVRSFRIATMDAVKRLIELELAS